jgi:hypothetical protein
MGDVKYPYELVGAAPSQKSPARPPARHFHVLPENMDLRSNQPTCVIHVLHFHVLPENMDLRSKKLGLRGGECDRVWVIPY